MDAMRILMDEHQSLAAIIHAIRHMIGEIEAGRLQLLFPQRLKSDYAHYLVLPPRSREHAGLAAFRAWLLEEAHAYARELAKPAAAKPARPRPGKR